MYVVVVFVLFNFFVDSTVTGINEAVYNGCISFVGLLLYVVVIVAVAFCIHFIHLIYRLIFRTGK